MSQIWKMFFLYMKRLTIHRFCYLHGRKNHTAFRRNACWLSQKYDIHYTPKHGSWLNMAETELISMIIQCLGNQRTDTIEQLNGILNAWEVSRNQWQKRNSMAF